MNRTNQMFIPVLNFYRRDINISRFYELVVKDSKDRIPLCVYNWFVTNYSKKNDIRYDIRRPDGRIEKFVVYHNYLIQLDAYKKKEFDPCRRGDLITLNYTTPEGEEVSFDTAPCQLRFFKWVIENFIDDYIMKHFDEIYKDMTECQKQPLSRQKNLEKIKKKTELSQSIYKGCFVSNQPITIRMGEFEERV